MPRIKRLAALQRRGQTSVSLSTDRERRGQHSLAARQEGRGRHARGNPRQTTLTSAQRDGKARGRPGCRQTNQCVKTGPSVTSFRVPNIVLHFPRQTSSQQTRGWTLRGHSGRDAASGTAQTRDRPRGFRHNAGENQRMLQCGDGNGRLLEERHRDSPSSVHPRRLPMCLSCEPAALGRNSKSRLLGRPRP